MSSATTNIDKGRALPALFAGSIFIGSFLLFQVQLILGKCILPWFGGSPGVWNTCLLFFQGMLLVGYLYAHVVTSLKLRHQVYVHTALLLLSLLFIQIIPSDSWKPSSEGNPVVNVLLLLVATAGLPYFLLSASSPLLQYWYVQRFPSHSPWRLYALSNAASLLGLISYPFFFEPLFGLHRQGLFWGWNYFAYIGMCIFCSISLLSLRTSPEVEQNINSVPVESIPAPISGYTVFLWVMIAACSSSALLAVTNELCLDLASVPLLWMLPLVIYLATYIICFSNTSHYQSSFWSVVFVVSIIVFEYFKQITGLAGQVGIIILVLLSCCMVCHGELVRLRPVSRKLTLFYISIAGGGVLGSAFVSLIAPTVFTRVVELPIALTAVFGVLLIAHIQKATCSWQKIVKLIVIIGFVGHLWHCALDIRQSTTSYIELKRSFFGTLQVDEAESNAGQVRRLFHGTTLHGYQFQLPENREFPTSYYTAESGVGVTLRLFPTQGKNVAEIRNKRVGVIGLGIGTVATYGIPGDTYRFYEINEDVIRIAKQHFSFLADSKARIEIVHRDARLALDEELSGGNGQQFDVLIVDAFSSDSIPIHLLTREAVVLYSKHLKPDGVIIFNITSRYFNLWPIIKGHGVALGMESVLLLSETNSLMGSERAYWGVLTKNTAFLRQKEVLSLTKSIDAVPINWTDSFASILQVL
jgi:hypothetical protein